MTCRHTDEMIVEQTENLLRHSDSKSDITISVNKTKMRDLIGVTYFCF